jgi:hypothetical protein
MDKNKEKNLKKEFKEIDVKRCEVRRSREKSCSSHLNEIRFAFLITRNTYCVLYKRELKVTKTRR